eukprot:scaffold261573_cov17-Tisochrysis_lutea.AAC.1
MAVLSFTHLPAERPYNPAEGHIQSRAAWAPCSIRSLSACPSVHETALSVANLRNISSISTNTWFMSHHIVLSSQPSHAMPVNKEFLPPKNRMCRTVTVGLIGTLAHISDFETPEVSQGHEFRQFRPKLGSFGQALVMG